MAGLYGASRRRWPRTTQPRAGSATNCAHPAEQSRIYAVRGWQEEYYCRFVHVNYNRNFPKGYSLFRYPKIYYLNGLFFEAAMNANVRQGKLIVLRGNSGAGKSTLASRLRALAQDSLVIVEQDYFRRSITGEKDRTDALHVRLMEQTVRLSIVSGFNVVLEGILNFERHGSMLTDLAKAYSDHFFYYLDVSFDESWRRHCERSKRSAFGRDDMARWFVSRDFTGLAGETVLPEQSSIDVMAAQILKQADLG
ncbi:hypothetical protein LMG29542_08265 [Paraburkholderia humisilvae]|uniref:UDP-N-acetylglucosamine kinase n=2 Tax=Paraburkholderia humisilvae TaxID=627669 RepID=A0A6J5F932_9BURK|nr:hypothetical protein LMG29542_08265 [Paraburkholderia humisilvae]